MKKEYSYPEIKITKFTLSSLLMSSDPNQTVTDPEHDNIVGPGDLDVG